MKIENSPKNVISITGGDTPKRAEKAAAAPARPAASQEKVELSALSSQLKAAGTGLAGDGVFDTAKIQEIKQAISDGRFKVNAEVVADRLLDTVKELLQAHRKEIQ